MNASACARDSTWYAASGTAATATGEVTDVSMYCATSLALDATAFSTFRAQASRRGVTRIAMASSQAQLTAFIGKFDAKDQRLIRAVRSVMRRRCPTANELVYDNYNFFVIGYSPTQRPSDAVVSMAARAGSIGLCFIRGASLPDPKGLLLGSGKQTRFIRLESADTLARPEVEALIAAAVDRARTPFAAAGGTKLIIRSVSAKQRY